MKTLKLFGIGTHKNRGYFILEKDESFRDSFNKILEKIGSAKELYKEEGSIKEMNNKLENYTAGDFDIDIVYTSDRIIVIARVAPEKLQEFKSWILEFAEMPAKK